MSMLRENVWKWKCLRYLFELESQEITNGVWILDTIITGIPILIYHHNGGDYVGDDEELKVCDPTIIAYALYLLKHTI